MHSLNIIYRDLKPENILLSFDGHIKVADFGFAKACASVTWTLCGTPDYLAPEIISQQRYNKSVDWYALGVLMYEMLTGLPPYHQAQGNPAILHDKITAGPAHIRWPSLSNNDEEFPSLAKDLIVKLMECDPSKRYGNMQHGAGDVFAHAWFREVDWYKLCAKDVIAPFLPQISGEGDASAFQPYDEDVEAIASYGLPSNDPYGHCFPDFEYNYDS